MEESPKSVFEARAPYLVYIFETGFGIVSALIYSGYNGWKT